MKKDEVYLLHIRDAIKRIESYTGDGKDAFLREPIIQDAVIRNLEIIGEAAKNLSAAFRSENAEQPWSKISGMRDVLIHEYFGVRLETVWAVVSKRLPELKRFVDSALR